ncbi:MAG: hypothetical protein M1829_001096, partial [Trizodia sp. TS-e1964]
MATKYAQEEILIARAIGKLKNEANSNVKATAQDFGVSYDRLRYRYLGRCSSKMDCRSPN